MRFFGTCSKWNRQLNQSIASKFLQVARMPVITIVDRLTHDETVEQSYKTLKFFGKHLVEMHFYGKEDYNIL